MRVAALFDVHGNLPALEAVLADVARSDVETIVCGGDVVWGPFQGECLALLREADAVFLSGNCERNVLHPTSARDAWSRAQLGDDDCADVASWPAVVRLEVEGLGRVLLCHATPSNDEAIVTRLTPPADAQAAIGVVAAEVVVCGHTHVQFDRVLPGGIRLVNPGSVGLAYEDVPGAYWALVGPDVELRRSDYDVESAAAAIEATGFPEAGELFGAALRGEISAAVATGELEARRGA